MATALATDKQVSFLRKLANERGIQSHVDAEIKAGLTKQNASRWISTLMTQPVTKSITPSPRATAQSGFGAPKEVHPDLTPGVYDVDGHVYTVKFNREGTRLYANHIVESPDRLNANDELVDIDFVYSPGAIFNIKPEHRMSFEDAKVLTIRYGRCIACGRRLKAGKSVEQGIGPVCRKKFA